MGGVLAVLVAAGFVWSLVLFVSAVFVRERSQEAGFLWALAGALVYFVTFCDRLPGSPHAPRHLLEILPGSPRLYFSSSIPALLVLIALYFVRLAVFYQLLFDIHIGPFRESNEDVVNDLVAPLLSYFALAVCVVTMLSGVYSFSWVTTAGVSLALIAAYFSPLVLRRFYKYLHILRAAILTAIVHTSLALRTAVIHLIIRIAKLELLRRSGDVEHFSRWADAQLDKLGKAREEADRKRGQRFADVAERARARTTARKKHR
jgi:hypothetical protein